MARDAWSEAAAFARELGVGYVGTDMLLLGLTRTDGVAAEVLAEAGVTEEAVAKLIRDINRAGEAPATEQELANPRPTPAAQHARGRAEGFGIALGIESASVRLLLALAYDRNGLHSSTLHHIGADRAAIVRALADRGILVPPTPPAPDRAPFSVSVILPDEQARVVARELAKRSTEDMDFWFDAWGSGRWGYGGVEGRPGDARISGEEQINLPALVREILVANGYPPPPDDAWEPRDEA
jgi:hypothetical protein